MTHLVDSRWLNDNLDNVVVIDATTAFDPSEPSNQVQARNSRAAYEAGHIPGAVHADLMDTLAKPDTQLHCIALESGAFQEIARGLGVSEGSHVVVYDQGAMMWATRLWWNLRLEGHENVSVLDGGLPAWKAAGFPVEEGVVEAAPGDFTARRRPELYATAEDVAEATDTGSAVVINALDNASHSQARIPGSVNVPFTDSLTGEGLVARPEEVRASYEETGALETDKPVITYCGAGIAATFDAFQLARLGREDVRVYDGSLTDWTSGDARPLESD